MHHCLAMYQCRGVGNMPGCMSLLFRACPTIPVYLSFSIVHELTINTMSSLLTQLGVTCTPRLLNNDMVIDVVRCNPTPPKQIHLVIEIPTNVLAPSPCDAPPTSRLGPKAHRWWEMKSARKTLARRELININHP